MDVFITGMGCVSPQNTFDSTSESIKFHPLGNLYNRAIEPSYKPFLDPVLARRMGRVIKMSIAASVRCLEEADVQMPGAIISGTALGCIESTEKFLTQVIEDDEQFLTPTQFIQSTHNTVSAQIALQLHCLNYNFTYVHRGFSFESALLDAIMTVSEGTDNVLVGGHDELTENNFQIYSRIGTWKKDPLDGPLWQSILPGSIAGEGAAFFNLSKTPGKKNIARIRDVKTIYQPAGKEEIESKISAFLNKNGLSVKEVDLVIYGISGDVRTDGIYYDICNGMLSESSASYYKHLCGEYQTATSFATWLAAKIIELNDLPEEIVIRHNHHKLHNVLIYNHYMDVNHSLILLSDIK